MIRSGTERNVGRDRFPDIVRQLLMMGADGAYRRFDHRSSDFWFSIERVQGSDDSADLALRIPRTEEVLALGEELRRKFSAHELRWASEENNPSLLAKVLLPVDDIWAKNSGASGAHAARLLLEALQIPQSARFDVFHGGYPSNRWKKRDVSDLTS
jgi:hypothetical protein